MIGVAAYGRFDVQRKALLVLSQTLRLGLGASGRVGRLGRLWIVFYPVPICFVLFASDNSSDRLRRLCRRNNSCASSDLLVQRRTAALAMGRQDALNGVTFGFRPGSALQSRQLEHLFAACFRIKLSAARRKQIVQRDRSDQFSRVFAVNNRETC